MAVTLPRRARGVLAAACLAAAGAAVWGGLARWRRAPADPFGDGSPPRRRLSVVLGQLPLMLHPSARSALLLGWGDGAAAGSMLSHPLRRLDAVAAIGERFAKPQALAAAGRPLDDSRLSVREGEFEAALAAPGPAYDVIVCDGSCSERAVHLAALRLAPRG